MIVKTLNLVAFLIAVSFRQRLSFNDSDCTKYKQKFDRSNNPKGTGATKMAFTGDVAFFSGSTDVKVNLRYSDIDLYNDPTYLGLVQEDGKTAATTCLDLKLWKFTSNTYSDGVQVTDLPITPSKNFEKKFRYNSFTILGGEFAKRLVCTLSNSDQLIYQGFYAIAYYAAGTNQLQYNFDFEFFVTISRTGSPPDITFKPLSYSSTINCNPNYIFLAKADTVFRWFTDLTCTSFAKSDLHFDDQFFIQQVVTTQHQLM